MLETKSYTRKLTQFVETRIKTRPRFSSRVALMTRNVRDGAGDFVKDEALMRVLFGVRTLERVVGCG